MAGTGPRHLEIGRSGSIGQVLKALKRVGRGSSQAIFEPERGVLTVGLERWRLRAWRWAGLGDCCWCAGFGVCCRRCRQRSRADMVVRVDFEEDDEKEEERLLDKIVVKLSVIVTGIRSVETSCVMRLLATG